MYKLKCKVFTSTSWFQSFLLSFDFMTSRLSIKSFAFLPSIGIAVILLLTTTASIEG